MLAFGASTAQAQSGGVPGDTTTTPAPSPAPAPAPTAGSWTLMQKATWYGPGFYGRRTACGTRLTKTTLGVAHKKLPCGTQVTFSLNGLTVDTTVIDRGPFRKGYKWDLTKAAADAIGFSEIGAGVLEATVTPAATTTP